MDRKHFGDDKSRPSAVSCLTSDHPHQDKRSKIYVCDQSSEEQTFLYALLSRCIYIVVGRLQFFPVSFLDVSNFYAFRMHHSV